MRIWISRKKIGEKGMKIFFGQGVLVFFACLIAACASTSRQPGAVGPVSQTGAAEDLAVSEVETDDLSSETLKMRADPITMTDDAIDKEGMADLNKAASLVSSASETYFATDKAKRIDKDGQIILDEALEFCAASHDFWSKGDFDNAVASLDEAYSLLLEANTSEKPKLVQQKEEIRFVICKRMLEIYASQRTVVNGNHNAIPMVMNKHVEKEIKYFQGQEGKFFIESYRRSGRFRPHILKALKEAGLPEELSWLPLIESGFKVRALSRARALGLWQFIPSTGYKFGLTRDRWVDERMDIAKSTQAAIAYMKELHNIFGDWRTVLAAYNCGEFRVLRLIRNQNINYLDDFWDLFRQLPWETARYVPRFIAALYIINDPERFGFELGDAEPPLKHELVEISKQIRLTDIAKSLDIPKKELQLLNSELRYKVTPPKAYKLKVPEGKGSVLAAKLDDVPAYVPPRTYYAYHRVQRGQTLSHLARRYRTSIRAIMQANNLRSANYLRVGQRLKIPARGESRTYVQTRQAAQSNDISKPLHHRVKRGDSLWLLARAYKTNIKEIMRLNNLRTTRLHVGQVLIVRKGLDGKMLEGTRKYQVRKGDSPYQIAMSYNMELGRFLHINHLTPRSRIYPGQTLFVDAK